jgi:hypothetical protein
VQDKQAGAAGGFWQKQQIEAAGKSRREEQQVGAAAMKQQAGATGRGSRQEEDPVAAGKVGNKDPKSPR